MENRSFDHMIGWMKRLNPEINGVDGSEFNSLNTSDPNSKRIFFQNQAHYVDPDPGHSFQAIREQIFGSDSDNTSSGNPPPMNGFAQQAYSMDNTTTMSQDVMNGFDPDVLAVYKALVSEFAVFDRYCSYLFLHFFFGFQGTLSFPFLHFFFPLHKTSESQFLVPDNAYAQSYKTSFFFFLLH